MFLCHGLPGSRFGGRLLADAAEERGVHLVGLNRPGMGLSTFHPDRRLLDWASEVRHAADHLGFDHFGVVGLSAGAPHAAACAHAIDADRLTGAALVSGVVPSSFPDRGRFGRLAFGTMARVPVLTRPTFAVVAWQARNRPDATRTAMRRQMATGDDSVLGDDAGKSLHVLLDDQIVFAVQIG